MSKHSWQSIIESLVDVRAVLALEATRNHSTKQKAEFRRARDETSRVIEAIEAMLTGMIP